MIRPGRLDSAPMDRAFLLTVEFDGGEYAGWQRQPRARTVQGDLEAAIERLTGRRIVVHGAGRTDAGVHATGFGASCRLPERWSPTALGRALNALLQDDCRVARVEEMALGFHARRDALTRTYRYEIGTDDACRSPFRHRWEWALGLPLDGTALDSAAWAILGDHDFHRLSVRSSSRPHYRCRIDEAAWSLRPDGMGWRFMITADRFLHHMVRMLVGTMADIALHRRPAPDLARLLAHDPAVRTSPPAPAEGLYFASVRYPATAYLHPRAESA